MGLQKSQPVPLSDRLILRRLQLLHQRGRPHAVFTEPGQVCSPDLLAGHLVDLAQDAIADEGPMPWVGDEAPEFQLDDVVDLLLG